MDLFKSIFQISCLFLLFLSACNKKEVSYENKSIDGKIMIVKKTYDKEGNIISEEILDKDSIKSGYHKEYILGKMRDSGNYVNGKKEGTWFYWDLAGETIKKENFLSGKKFGEEIEYYNKTLKGPGQLYKYCFYDVEGQKIFESKFDVDGKLLESIGAPIYCAYNKANLNAGETYELICFLGVPPNSKWKFSVAEVENSKQKTLFANNYSQLVDLEELPYAKRFYHTKKYMSKGIYDWKLYLEVETLSGDTIFNGPTVLKVSIK